MPVATVPMKAINTHSAVISRLPLDACRSSYTFDHICPFGKPNRSPANWGMDPFPKQIKCLTRNLSGRRHLLCSDSWYPTCQHSQRLTRIIKPIQQLRMLKHVETPQTNSNNTRVLCEMHTRHSPILRPLNSTSLRLAMTRSSSSSGSVKFKEVPERKDRPWRRRKKSMVHAESLDPRVVPLG